jgi:hypothetical protein
MYRDAAGAVFVCGDCASTVLAAITNVAMSVLVIARFPK